MKSSAKPALYAAWTAVRSDINEWAGQCQRALQGWQMPSALQNDIYATEQLFAASKTPTFVQPTQDAKTYIEEQYRKECSERMEWYLKNGRAGTKEQVLENRRSFKDMVS